MPETANSALVDIVREVRANIKELNKTINQQNNIISDLNFHIEDKVRIIKAAEKCINDQVILIQERDEKIKKLEKYNYEIREKLEGYS